MVLWIPALFYVLLRTGLLPSLVAIFHSLILLALNSFLLVLNPDLENRTQIFRYQIVKSLRSFLYQSIPASKLFVYSVFLFSVL